MKPSILVSPLFGKNSSYQVLGLVLMAIIAIGMPASFSVTQITLDTQKNLYVSGETISIKGQIANSPNQLVAIEVKDPAGITMMVRTVKTGSDGNFALQFQLSPTAQSGNYDIIANSNINGNIIKTTKLISTSNTSTGQKTSQTIHIPMWVKNNANWWSTGKITDTDFKMGIEYMIQHKIIVIPITATGSNLSQYIPSWVKNDAGWWSKGQISDYEFVGALQYLIINGIIIIK